MPRKPKMGDRMDALETQMVDVKATLQTLAQQMQQQSSPHQTSQTFSNNIK